MSAARARVRWILVAACLSRLAAADPARRVLLDPGSQPSLSRKVRAEASQVGLVVTVIQARSITSDDDAASVLAREDGAAAVVTLLAPRKVGIYVPSPGGAEFEILSGLTEDDDTFSLRVVEHLRARISALPGTTKQELGAAAGEATALSATAESTAPAAAPSGKPPPSGAVATPPLERASSGSDRSSSHRNRNRERGFWLEGGGGYGVRPGGLESGWRAAVGGRYAFDSFSVGAIALIPLSASEFHENSNTAQVQSWSYLAKGAVHHYPVERLGLSLGPGLGVVVQSLQGTAAPPLESRSDTVVSAALFAHGEVSWALSPWMRLAFALQTGAVVPRVAVRFEGRDVTGTGTWFVDTLLVARLRLGSPGGEF